MNTAAWPLLKTAAEQFSYNQGSQKTGHISLGDEKPEILKSKKQADQLQAGEAGWVSGAGKEGWAR